MSKQKRQLLNRLMEGLMEYDDDNEEFSLFTAEELNAPMDVLRGFHTGFGSGMIGVLGEYFFQPLDEEDADEVWYFSTVFTLTDNLPEDGIEDVAMAIARLNARLPVGCFALTGEKDRTFVFKQTIPLIAAHSEQVISDLMMQSVDGAFVTAERFSGMLMMLARGELTLRQFFNAIGG